MGAICQDCGKDMTKVEGCNLTTLVSDNGTEFERVKYGNEEESWGADEGHRCHDCNCSPGQLHHLGCDVERCPKCGNQLISCGCFSF